MAGKGSIIVSDVYLVVWLAKLTATWVLAPHMPLSLSPPLALPPSPHLHISIIQYIHPYHPLPPPPHPPPLTCASDPSTPSPHLHLHLHLSITHPNHPLICTYLPQMPILSQPFNTTLPSPALPTPAPPPPPPPPPLPPHPPPPPLPHPC